MSLVLGLGLVGSSWPSAAQDAPAGEESVLPGEAPPEIMVDCAEPNADPVLCDGDQADPAPVEAAPEASDAGDGRGPRTGRAGCRSFR
jgi:hypothetical protein